MGIDRGKDLRIALVGARGHVGNELVALLESHPRFATAMVCSRERAGERVAIHLPVADATLRYASPDPAAIAAARPDAVLLAMPNGMAAPYVEAIERAAPETVLVDLSADFRFDATWHYGLPERTRSGAGGQRRIANPGCYATAMQLSVAPFLDLLSGPVQCFGVSGYSGAGTSPSPRNDPLALRDNLMPYALTGHLHEQEVATQLDCAIEFMPHVAPHFRGLAVTTNLHFGAPQDADALQGRLRAAYAAEPLVRVVDEAPWVSRIAGCHHAEVGGLALARDGRRAVLVATLDNLLKGAATQALQNLNLAFGLPELTGIPQPAQD